MPFSRTMRKVPSDVKEWERFFKDLEIDSGSIALSAIESITANSIVANLTNAAASPAQFQATTNGYTLRVSGGLLEFGTLDHGVLIGLGDDDHPQYPLAASTETISGAWTYTSPITFLGGAVPSTPASTYCALYATTNQDHTLLNVMDEDGTALRVCRDNVVIVRNTSGVAMTKGQVVNVTGSTGTTPTVGLADADTFALHAEGILTEDIANNGYGLAMVVGLLTGLDTAALVEGGKIYLSQTAGAYTQTAPTTGEILQELGVVTRSHLTQGIIEVSIQTALGTISNNLLSDMDQSRIKGRAEGAGTGDPTDLTPAQVVAIIDGEVVNWSARQQVFGTTTANLALVSALGDTGVSIHCVEQIRTHRVAGEPFFQLLRVNTSYAAPSTLVSGNSAGSISWGGYDGTTIQGVTANIFLDITETWSGTARGGNLRFQTTTTGSTTKTDRLQIGADSTGGFVRIPDGVVGQPGLAFITDTDSGLYRIGANSFGAGTGGTLAMSWDSSQNALGKAAIRSDSATAGVGYATGAGGTVTQITSRTTGVTINKVCGAITLVSAAGSASWQSFTVTNSAVATTDVVTVNQKSGTDLNLIHVTAIGAGSFQITFATTGGTTVEQPVFNFAVIKGVAA